jgi:hypothetical protein
VSSGLLAWTSLDSNRGELETSRHYLVDVLPKAFGALGGAAIGMSVAGPPGAIGGGLAGVVSEEALRAAQGRLFGWVLDRLPFYSARKLLMRAVNVDFAKGAKLRQQLEAMWETSS